jgi:hypothetical protein
VVSVEHRLQEIDPYFLWGAKEELGAAEAEFGSSMRRGSPPQKWATFRVPDFDEAKAEVFLKWAVGAEKITDYFFGDSLQDAHLLRCNACGQRNAAC